MSTTSLNLGLLVGALAGVLYITLNLLVQSTLPYLQTGIMRALHKMPPRLQRRIENAARQTGEAQEAAIFVMEQGAMAMTLVTSVVLPLPAWVSWVVFTLILVKILRARLARRLLLGSASTPLLASLPASMCCPLCRGVPPPERGGCYQRG